MYKERFVDSIYRQRYLYMNISNIYIRFFFQYQGIVPRKNRDIVEKISCLKKRHKSDIFHLVLRFHFCISFFQVLINS